MRITSTIFAALIFAALNLEKKCEAQANNSTPLKVMCYLLSLPLMEIDISALPVNGLSVEELNDPGHCTHVAFSSLYLGRHFFFKLPDDLEKTEEGELREAFFRKGHEMRRHKPGLKLLLNIFASSSEINSPLENQQFVNNTIQFLKEKQLDGLHLECEKRGQNHCFQLISELCEEFGKHNLELSASIRKTSLERIEPKHSCLQFVVIETNFRPHTSAAYTEILNPVSNENATIALYEEQGLPRSKMLVMFSLSACTFTLSNPQNNSVGSLSDGPGLDGIPLLRGEIPVSEMLKRLNNSEEGWVVRRDASSNTPYAVNADGIWATYEDFSSITDKARFIKDLGLGGVVVRTMELDDWKGELGHGRFPFIRALNDALHSSK